ncbi:RNA-binding ATPase activator esf2 [Emydomyces testavorans]|uniref:Pre-rRNA-processing protein ESF2 n=1 Tax=Emydomyces testavorans TaxID=2070801 RepID=A0AAF0DMY2_9EURO|nr:RNA-binding ATPase activator esf2 [Emydomyces testavorans]
MKPMIPLNTLTMRKRIDFWDVPSDEEEVGDAGYDSEAAQESKGKSSKAKSAAASSSLRRPSKRRKLSIIEVDSESENETRVGNEEDAIGNEIDEQDRSRENQEAAASAIDSTTKSTSIAPTTTTTTTSKTTTTTTATTTTPSIENTTPSPPPPSPDSKPKPKKPKTGVIYLSSLPPYLKPSALKSLLHARGFGPITKTFLTPSTPSSSSSSSASKRSNKRRMYADGWVEFSSKRTAKICAATLNATIVGGKKGGWYHDDVWNMKYLRGFKWADLMEQVQREKKEEEARRRIEDARARKEEKVFLAGVERGRVVEGIRRRREEKKKGRERGIEVEKLERPRVVFRQNEVRDGGGEKDGARKEGKVDADVQRVLAKIF